MFEPHVPSRGATDCNNRTEVTGFCLHVEHSQGWPQSQAPVTSHQYIRLGGWLLFSSCNGEKQKTKVVYCIRTLLFFINQLNHIN